MSIELTEQQQDALAAQTEEPFRVINPRTQETYFLVRADQFDHIRGLLGDGPFTTEERQAILQGVWNRAGWDDPRMDQYELLVARKST